MLAKAIQLAFTLSLHDEKAAIQAAANRSSDEGPLDAIELELRRRAYWILYGSDKTIAAVEKLPILMRDDCATVTYPLPVDDELVTRRG